VVTLLNVDGRLPPKPEYTVTSALEGMARAGAKDASTTGEIVSIGDGCRSGNGAETGPAPRWRV
jgi:hypothetical protein